MELISSRQNEKVKHIVALCDSARLRVESGACVAHGLKLCREALRLGMAIESLWITSSVLERGGDDIEALIKAAHVCCRMSDSVCEKLSPQASPQGVVAVVKTMPPKTVRQLAVHNRIVVLDCVQDPGNVGAIIRTAAALGYGGILMDERCADPFSPKALRASMGAAFGVDIAVCGDTAQAIAALRETHDVVAAVVTDSAVDVARVKRAARMAIVIGSEGSGLPDDVVAACGQAAYIPIHDCVDSLNAAVAAGIAMWEMRDE